MIQTPTKLSIYVGQWTHLKNLKEIIYLTLKGNLPAQDDQEKLKGVKGQKKLSSY